MVLKQVLPLVGAGALGYVGYRLGLSLAEARAGAARRVVELAGLDAAKTAASEGVDFGSEAHKVRLAFRRLGLDVSGWESAAVTLARIVAAVGVFLILRLLGMPPLTALLGLLGGPILVSGFLGDAWNKVQKEIEREIPLFLSGLSSTAQVTPNVLQAVEDEARALRAGGALQTWLLTVFLPRCQREGFGALDDLVREAAGLSSSLGIVVFLIGRLWQTGGAEWRKAFETAAGNLEGVLDARVLGQSIGTTAKGSVRIIALITLGIIVMIVRTPALADTVQQPIVQFAYAGIVLAMIFGLQFMNKLIDEAF
jgi:hypothetical protein